METQEFLQLFPSRRIDQSPGVRQISRERLRWRRLVGTPPWPRTCVNQKAKETNIGGLLRPDLVEQRGQSQAGLYELALGDLRRPLHAGLTQPQRGTRGWIAGIGHARLLRNAKRLVNCRLGQPMRLPCNLLRTVGLPALGIARHRIKAFEFFGRGRRTLSSKLLLHFDYDCIVPGKVKIRLRRNDVDLLTGAAAIGVGRSIQRLVDVSYEMNEKGEIARCTPFVELHGPETMGVLVDFRGDAVSVGTSRGQVAFGVLKA